MKLLAHLEKNKLIWSIIALCVLFFFLRLPSLIEPYWYGDEGIYETMGLAMSKGHLLYRDIWDNKPPLLYVLYALAQGDQTTIRIFSLIAGLASVVVFFLLNLALFLRKRTAVIITLLYVLLFGSPLIEGNIANAENFILLPVITAALLVVKQFIKKNGHTVTVSKEKLFVAGVVLGIAFLLKIVAIFDLAAFSLFVLLYDLEKIKRHQIQIAIKTLLPMLIGFLIPFILSVLYFASFQTLPEYFRGAFSGNVDYVGFENYLFGIPQGLLIMKLLLLSGALYWIVINRKRFHPVALFITLWTVFALFSANFSGRPYTHYLLVLLPSFCLLVGMALDPPFRFRAKASIIAAAAIALFVIFAFPTYGLDKTFAYYPNTLFFLSGNKDLQSYQSFFDSKTPRDYALATFIKQHTHSNDKIFIWGDSAQLYVLSGQIPPYKYTVAYHVKQDRSLLQETQTMINTEKPKYIIVLPETQPLPFSVPLYIMRFDVEGATIYERII